MIFIYERSTQTLQVETRFDNATSEYVLIIRPLDGTEQVERSRDRAAFQSRINALEHQLDADHWQNRSAIALQDGWKL